MSRFFPPKRDPRGAVATRRSPKRYVPRVVKTPCSQCGKKSVGGWWEHRPGKDPVKTCYPCFFGEE